MGDTPTLARFITGWVQEGLSDDGLPYFREVLKIVKSRPPYLQLEQVATEDDIAEYAPAFALFQKQQAAVKAQARDGGFPLALWPAVTAAELQMLSVRDIITVEQLAGLAGRRAEDIPGEIKILAQRAKKMIELSSEVGKFEQIILEKDGQLTALNEQVKELRATIQAQDGIINSLKAKVA